MYAHANTHTHKHWLTEPQTQTHLISLGHLIYWGSVIPWKIAKIVFLYTLVTLLMFLVVVVVVAVVFFISKWFINNWWHCVSLLYHCSLVIVASSNCVCMCFFPLFVIWISFDFQFLVLNFKLYAEKMMEMFYVRCECWESWAGKVHYYDQFLIKDWLMRSLSFESEGQRNIQIVQIK